MIIIFFLPYISDNFPAIGVMTAPATRYAVSIQEEALYDMLKSLMILGIAGRSIVSPYIVIKREEPRMPSVSHDDCGIFVRSLLEPSLPFLLDLIDISQFSISFLVDEFKYSLNHEIWLFFWNPMS